MLGEEELSKHWTISQSGDLYLPYVGRVPGAGRSVTELENDLTDRFKQYIRNPVLSVAVAELRSRPVTVTGAVRNPGIYQIEGGVKLFQVLALAGGVEQAGSIIALIRQKSSGSINLPGAKWLNGGGEMSIELSLKDVLRADGPAAVLELCPHDVVRVERNRDRLVYIAGEVNTPGAIQLDTVNALFITQALALAGGYKSSAQMANAVLWSCCDGDQPRMTRLNLKKILEGKDEDRKLHEGDYLLIPPRNAGGILPTLISFSALANVGASLAVISRR
jgi:polysaccharide export outer membrane protein